MLKSRRVRLLALILLVVVIAAIKVSGLGSTLSFDNLKNLQLSVTSKYHAQPLLVAVGFFLTYVCAVAFLLPFAIPLTLLGGAVFGLLKGTLLVSFSASIGATISFLAARFVFRDSVQKRFGSRLEKINEGIKKDGPFYLFGLRLIPLVPFFVLNPLMGLTPMSPGTFYLTSQIGMLPGTLVYVFAGTQLAQITSISGILTPQILFVFILLGCFPILSKKTFYYLKAQKILSKYPRPEHFDYNVAVIGGGSAGLVTAYISSMLKAKVVLIEKNKMGGDCLNTGCVPSKALIRSAQILAYAKRASKYGIKKLTPSFDFNDVIEQVHKTISKIAPNDSVDRYSKLGVDCLNGHATLRDPYTIEVGGKVITAKNIVIATGAKPLVPAIPGLSQIDYFTSDSIWELKHLPKKLLILGGGPIGCELGQSFARFGSKVTIVEKSPRILSKEDPQASKLLEEVLVEDGIELATATTPKEIKLIDGKKVLIAEVGGMEKNFEFSDLLFCLGRKPNTFGMGLESLGFQFKPNGTFEVDEFLRTTFPNIYACGDVVGPYQFTHVASHQAWFCAINSLFSPFWKFKADYRVIPWCTFTDPQIAQVGLNEYTATSQKVPFDSTYYDLAELDRGLADSENRGFVKILTVPKSDKILGATIVGAYAGEMITEFVTAMKFGLGLNKILSTIHIYPTYSEANKMAAGKWRRQNSPEGIFKYLEKFHTLRRQ